MKKENYDRKGMRKVRKVIMSGDKQPINASVLRMVTNIEREEGSGNS